MLSVIDLGVIFDWVEGLLVSSWYWLVPLGTFLESTAIVSLAAPGLIIVLLAGYYSGLGLLPLPIVMLLALVGTLSGDTASFFLGRFIWNRFLVRRRFARKIDEIALPLVNRTIWFIPLLHFSGFGRALVPLTLGALRKMPFSKWLVLDAVGAVLWNVTFGLLGYFAGVYGSIEDVSEARGLIEWIFLAMFLGWIVTLVLTTRRLIGRSAKQPSHRL